MNGIIIHTDGSCHGNPGPGGYAAIIQIPNHDPMVIQGRNPSTTNNRMEIGAIIAGLASLRELANVAGVSIEIRTDSMYVVNAFNKGWLQNWQRNGWRTADRGTVKNQDLWEQLTELTREMDLTFTHVRGHAGNAMNEECDRIANLEAEQAALGNSTTQHCELEASAAEHSSGLRSTPEGSGPHEGEPQAATRTETDAGSGRETPGREEYDRGYRAGYEACLRDMANALNGLHPQAQDPQTEMPDDLPF